MQPPTTATSQGIRSLDRTASGVSAGGLERPTSGVTPPSSRGWSQSLAHHLVYIVGYNWLVALTIAPIAFAAAWLLAVELPELVRNPWRPPPVAVLCVAGYIFFEVTSFCLERNWSQMGIFRFWRLAIPLGALQLFLCLKLARHDALGCLLFIALCLGTREFLLQLQANYPSGRDVICDRQGCTQDKLTSAFLGGSFYGMAVALICGMSGSLVHAVVGDGRKVFSTLYIDVLIVVALPLGRNMARVLLNQMLTAATSTASFDQPKLDALLMYGDILFLLTLFMEIPFAFAFLLVNRTFTFCLALLFNLVIDVMFVQALDVVKRRDALLLMKPAAIARNPATPRSEPGLELGTREPTYCIERPESIWACLARGAAIYDEASESKPLQGTPDDGRRSCCPYFEIVWRNWCPRRKSDDEDHQAAAMSPRITLLLDEHNNGVIGCWAGRAEFSKGSALAVFLRQERKIAFTTHFLGSTLAIALVTIALPIAKYASDNYHTEFLGLRHISATELAIRATAVILLRILADLVALRLLDLSSDGSEAPALWESRHELSTFHGWLFRALAATCPLFAVIAATL